MFILNEGETKTFHVLIKRVEEKQGTRSNYINVVFTDGEAEMAANACKCLQMPGLLQWISRMKER